MHFINAKRMLDERIWSVISSNEGHFYDLFWDQKPDSQNIKLVFIFVFSILVLILSNFVLFSSIY